MPVLLCGCSFDGIVSQGRAGLVLSLQIGFLLHTSMLVSGSFYKFLLFGKAWSFDPIETLGFIAWIAYGTLLHMHYFAGWEGPGGWQNGVCRYFFVLLVSYRGIVYFPAWSTYHIFDMDLRIHLTGDKSMTEAVLVMLNSYFHDLAVAVLWVSSLTAHLVLRYWPEGTFPSRSLGSLSRVAWASFVWVLVGGCGSGVVLQRVRVACRGQAVLRSPRWPSNTCLLVALTVWGLGGRGASAAESRLSR